MQYFEKCQLHGRLQNLPNHGYKSEKVKSCRAINVLLYFENNIKLILKLHKPIMEYKNLVPN